MLEIAKKRDAMRGEERRGEERRGEGRRGERKHVMGREEKKWR